MDYTQRPDFHPNMNPFDFNKYYWYKQELQNICRIYKTFTSGTKAELIERIHFFLQIGEASLDIRSKNTAKRNRVSNKNIHLQTRLIPDGFKFNQQARKFFQHYYGVKKFSFTKHMAAALRDAEGRNDTKMTVADLIYVYEQGKQQSKKTRTSEESTYQWNQFVKDFHQDPATKKLHPKMKIAALLWGYVRISTREKKYHHELLHLYHEEIQQIIDKK